jgi:mannose-6-phosphate isomerase-like protein (cupin superfamily)
VTRGSNFVIAITRVRPGTILESPDLPDEHFVLLHDTDARVEAATGSLDARTNHLLVVPPGKARIQARRTGWILRCFSARHTGLLALAANAAEFAQPREEVAPLADWPAPHGGHALRCYDLDEALRGGEKTRVFRSSNLMINILRERQEPRDISALSPHQHRDFEQASITLSGVHIHHLRYPWTPDMREWRADEALEVGAPSVVVIPPHVIHTTRNVNQGPALLIDLFASPRADFSLRPDMVRNAAEYPLPESLHA